MKGVLGIENNQQTLEDKIAIYLNDLESNGKTLYITDPYLLQVTDTYQDMLINLLKTLL